MHYTKPALSFEQQAQRLIDRGLLVADRATLVQRLSSVNYYRLSAYWYPFKKIDPATGQERLAPNTAFETIWRRYTFDRELRLLVMDAVERVEVAILRTRMVEQYTLLHGPFGYCERANFRPEFLPDDYAHLLNGLDDEVARSKEEFVKRFQKKYTDEPRLPLWMAVEVMTFGQLFTFFRQLHRTEQQLLAKQFDLFPPVLESWLHSLNFIRNACAHHARLWNREIPIRPALPEKKHHPEWYTPVTFPNDRIGAVLTLLRYLLGYLDPQHDWQIRLEQLFVAYPEIPLRFMGLPDNWRDCPIWKTSPAP
jgi:abortive infection bacteriophage resistance protein